MNTKNIGNIGEAKTLAKFIELGIQVYLPFGDNERADLIADFGGKLNKIQVKTSIKAENGVMIFDLTSSTMHRKNGVKHKYTPDEIDFFVCYNIERDSLYLLEVGEPRSTIKIRFEEPLNGQTYNINREEDYLFDNVIAKYI